MNTIQSICPHCMERLESTGKGLYNTMSDIINLYCLGSIPVIFQVNERNEETLFFLESKGFIVTSEFLDLKKIILIKPQGDFEGEEDDKYFCFKGCQKL